MLYHRWIRMLGCNLFFTPGNASESLHRQCSGAEAMQPARGMLGTEAVFCIEMGVWLRAKWPYSIIISRLCSRQHGRSDPLHARDPDWKGTWKCRFRQSSSTKHINFCSLIVSSPWACSPCVRSTSRYSVPGTHLGAGSALDKDGLTRSGMENTG